MPVKKSAIGRTGEPMTMRVERATCRPAVSRIVDVYEKPGKRSGSMTFAVTEAEYRNAQGALVARGLTVATQQDEAIELMADVAGRR
jgi:hypothetical protein